MSLVKGMVRFAVIGGLVGGAVVLIAGPDEVSAMIRQTRDEVRQEIGKRIKDPVALRAQLRSLEEQYPKRIGAVRGDLAELREQKAQLTREQSVSERVVELASRDIEQLGQLISRAETARDSAVQLANLHEGPTVVRVVFNNESLSLDDAYSKGTQIQRIRETYQTRLSDIDRDMGYVSKQEERLNGLLTQLETEHDQFQAQIWQLDRQVDSIARNDRMIDMMQKRQRTIDEQSRFKADSLDQLQGRLADIRARQESQLESLTRASTGVNYEDRAKVEIDAKRAWAPATPVVKPKVLEIRPETRPASTTGQNGSV